MVIQISSQGEWNRHLSGNKLVVVDFTATWCGPCKVVGPLFDKLSTVYKDVTFLKVDVDQNKDIATSCGIRAMPTFQFYKGGNKIGEVVGADINKVEDIIKKNRDSWGAAGGGNALGSTPSSSPASSSSSSVTPQARPPTGSTGPQSFFEIFMAFIWSFFAAFGLGGNQPATPSAAGSRQPAATTPKPQPAQPVSSAPGNSASKPVDPEERRRLMAEAVNKRSGSGTN